MFVEWTTSFTRHLDEKERHVNIASSNTTTYWRNPNNTTKSYYLKTTFELSAYRVTGADGASGTNQELCVEGADLARVSLVAPDVSLALEVEAWDDGNTLPSNFWLAM